MAGGRPTKLTDDMQATICAALEAGKRLQVACAEAGITRSTLSVWRREAAKGSARHAEFFDAVSRAWDVNEGLLIETVKVGDDKGVSNGPARGAQWLLERTRPKQYAQRLNVKLEEGLDELLGHVDRICAAKDCGCYEAILSALAASETGEDEAAAETGSTELH